MKQDLRLLPAACCAWGTAVVALLVGPGGRIGLAAAVLAGGTAAGWVGRHRRGWAAQALLTGAVCLAVLLVAHARLWAQGSGAVGDALAGGGAGRFLAVAEEPARLLGPGSRYEAMVVLRIGAAPVTALGPVAGLATGDRVTVTGTLAPLPERERSRALLLDAQALAVAPAGGPQGAVNRLRADFVELTGALSPQGQGLVPGIAIGDDSRLPLTVQAAMRRTSLSHLTAVSGAHIALVLAIVGFLGGRARVQVRALLLLAALAGLVLLVGTEGSVVRAGAMGVVGIAAVVRGRPPQPIPALSAGCAALLVADPWLALSYGFGLSVCATAGLVCLAPPLARRFARAATRLGRGRLPDRPVRWAAAALSLPLAAHLACAPIVIALNPAVTTWGVPANLVAAPAVVPATVLGLTALLLTPLAPGPALLLARGAELATGWIAGVALTLSRWPGAALPWPGGLGGALALGALHALTVVALLRRRPARPAAHPARWGLLAAAVGAAVAVAALLARLLPAGAADWAVLQCDVGQGTATLVRTGPHTAAMVDVGGADGAAEHCLARARVRRLDLLVLTHPHDDHVGHLAAVLAAVDVRAVLVSPAAEPAATVAWVERELRAVGVAPATASAGMAGRAGSVEWRVLWPAPRTDIRDANDLSVAVLFEGAGRVLALGDLQGRGQGELAAALADCGSGSCAPVDVAVMAHHGAADQNPELARLLDPAVTIVPVGENNYGHPTRTAVELYGSVSRVWRTDRDGQVSVSFHEDHAVVRAGG